MADPRENKLQSLVDNMQSVQEAARKVGKEVNPNTDEAEE